MSSFFLVYCSTANIMTFCMADNNKYNICLSATILQCYNITMLQYYNVTILQCYNITMLQYYNVTILQCYYGH